MNQQIKKIIKYFLVLVLAGVSVSALAQWAPPSATPPGGNVSVPINVGGSLQEKTGALVVGALRSNTEIWPGDGNFRIIKGDSSPNAGFFRFGDNSGWRLHFGRLRETTSGGINSGTTGAILTIQDNGRVGIGNTSPQALLDVNGTIRISGGNPGAGRVLTSDAQGFASWVAPTTSTSTSPWTVSGNNIFNSNTGNVGIGTGSTLPTLPVSRNGLIVKANSTNGVELLLQPSNASGANGLSLAAVGNDATVWNRISGSLAFGTNNTERIRITDVGRVGIGTTNPQALLDINGTIKLSDATGVSALVCDSNNAGMQRYTSNNMQFCNGTSWVNMSGGGTSGWTLGSNTITSSNNVISSGSSAGFRFNNRTSGSDFQWYASGTTARLFAHSSSAGYSDLLTVDSNGNVTIGNINKNTPISSSDINILKVQGGIKLYPHLTTGQNGSQLPTCNASLEGTIVYITGTGVGHSGNGVMACVYKYSSFGWRYLDND